MAKVNKRKWLITRKFIFLCSVFLLFQIFTLTFTIPTYADSPFVFDFYPKTIQYGTTNIVVKGTNLNSKIIGVSGSDVLAVITREDPQGKSLSVQFAVRFTAEPGAREIFLRDIVNVNEEARFTINVVPFGAPTIDSISQNTISPGSPFLLYITGMGLNNANVTTVGEQFSIISSQSSSDGSLLVISGVASKDAAPGLIQTIYITTPGGQASPVDLTVATAGNPSDTFDPYSPSVSEITSSDKSQIVIKGSMFDPDPLNNTVTILENNNGNVIGRQVDVISANNNEITIKLPDDITSSSISFAVSSPDGKSSNIKTVDLNSLQASTDSTITNNASLKTDTPTNTGGIALPPQISQTINTQTITITENNTGLHQHNAPQQDTNKQNETAPDMLVSSKTLSPSEFEETTIVKNIQSISQFLFSNSGVEIKNETVSSALDEIKDPLKIISNIEETKQIKNQADLIMLAINEAKQNQDLSETLKKAETLKNKVEELDKLLTTEKQKNNPNPRKLAKYQQLLETANAESKSQTFALLNNLLKYKPQLKNLLTQKPFDLAAIQPNIPNDSVILQYVPTEEGLIIFVVDNKNLKTRINKNITKEMLNKEVQAYRQLFENEIEKIKLTGRVTPITSWKDDKTNAYKKEILPLKEKSIYLYNALIKPVEQDIANKKVIAIIDNGWLRYLPFQSLATRTKDDDLKFLISDKSIVYLDSVIAVSKNPQVISPSMTSITIFANPDGTLIGANKEAEIISMLFTKTTSLIQKPFNISTINLLAKNADILHLATHGYLDGADISSSYLVSGKKENGKTFTSEKLFLKDLYDLNLTNSKLVVLSSCDTGKLGNLANEPDDIVGSLATAFRVAGANTILASLWKAHDEATKIIMQSFYENIKSGLNKAESLRRAELKVKENPKYAHPLFWALFSLIGDWR